MPVNATDTHAAICGVRVANANITVMGIGRFGGGLGIIQWLAEHGTSVLATDLLPEEQCTSQIETLQPSIHSGKVQLRMGAHHPDDFLHADVVIASPAVPQPWDNPFLCAARNADVPVTTEIQCVVERLNRDRVIAVTGSAGKSTTAAMIHHILNAMGHTAHFGGNIGGSLLSQLDGIDHARDFVVLELSSAMLYWLGSAPEWNGGTAWSPRVAVVTNIEPNHINWHGCYEHYRNSKLNIVRNQRGHDIDSTVAWFDEHNPDLVRAISDAPTEPVFLTAAAAQPVSLTIPGQHNIRNAQLAVAASCELLHRCGEANADHATLAQRAAVALQTFRGLPHRLEYVGEVNGCRCYNDSKATTPAATCLAVDAFDCADRIHLIVGGSDKGSDLSELAHLASRAKSLLTIGVTGSSIAAEARDLAPARTFECETLANAWKTAIERSQPGDIILLSPGCASFDQFENYEARGNMFRTLCTRASSGS
ncbi:MAG: UDP-N-acetylmuramoyl-L-alanine--D-glutamate ligase [Phycisphaerales bacterium]